MAKVSYITRLQQEKAELEKKVSELEQKTPELDPLDSSDDRNDMIVITYGLTAREYKQERMMKRDAVDLLFDYYVNRIPTERYVPKMDINGTSVNTAPCYVKITRRDGATRAVETYYKDMPLWILVDRMINHPSYLNMELVRREEWQADQDKAAEYERNLDKPRRERKMEQAADILIANQ